MKKNHWTLFLIVGIVLFVLSFVMWYAAPRWFDRVDYPYYGHMIGGWGMPLGMLGMGFFWMCVVIFGLRAFSNRENRDVVDAKEILKKRLANGEISIEEYEMLMLKLKEH